MHIKTPQNFSDFYSFLNENLKKELRILDAEPNPKARSCPDKDQAQKNILSINNALHWLELYLS
jgi:hypothetical protein